MNLPKVNHIFTKILFTVLSLSLSFSHCKLNLNNPGDPFSKSFLETFLLRAYLGSLCDPGLRGEVRLGSGAYFTVINDLKLDRGNLYFTASVSEPVAWNGRTDGVNFSFSGTTPTTNMVIGKINGRTFQIEWLDYLGVTNGNFVDAGLGSIFFFSNGDVGVSTIITSTQLGALNTKATDPTAAVYIVRFNSEGNRQWSRYLNKPTSEFNAGNSFTVVSDSLDRIHVFYETLNSTGTSDTIGFNDLPLPQNQTSPQINKNEIGWATVNGDGSPHSQRFIVGNSTNNHYLSVNTAVSTGNEIFLAGDSNGEVNGFSGHPLPGSSGNSTLYLKLGLDFSVQNVRYYGNSNGTETANILKFIVQNNRIFSYGMANGTFGNPAQQFLSDTNDSLLFMRLDSDLNLLWHSFLGSATSNFANDPGIISYEGRINSVSSKTAGTFDGLRFTGHDSISTGSSVNPFPSVTARMDPDLGTFRSLFYETNANSPTLAGITRLNIIRHYQDVCVGRMVTSKNEYLDNSGSIGYIQISTRPAAEEP